MTEEIIIDCGWYRNGWCGCETEDKKCEQIKLCKFKDDKLKQQLKSLEQENKELKEEIQFHNKENSNLLAERNAAQIGYDETREVRKRYRSALEEIREICKTMLQGISSNCINTTPYLTVLSSMENKINEVLG